MIPDLSESSCPSGNDSAGSSASSSARELLEAKSCIAAIDMDCFYAQCEELRQPELKGKPVGVQQKMLVITSNYAARAFGIKKGDSLQLVREKCPEITICNGEDLTFYGQVSQQVFDVASRFSSKVEKLGLDEVFLDVTEKVDERLRAMADENIQVQGVVYPVADEADTSRVDFSCSEIQCWKRLSVAASICHDIHQAIQNEVGLTSSAGVSVSKLLAKLVASWQKPAKQTIFVPTASRLSSLLPDSLAIQKIPGIGFSSTQRCNALDIHTIRDLSLAAESIADPNHPLLTAFDPNTVKTMRLLCLGIDKASVKASGAPKSCSAEDSFWQNPLSNTTGVKTSLALLAKKLLSKVRSVEQSFGFRPVPTLSLTLRHAGRDAEPRRERRQMQLGSFKVGNPNCKGNISSPKGDPLPTEGEMKTDKDAAETLSVNDQLLSQQLAQRAFGLFQKLVPNEPFSLHILNIQVGFSETVPGQQSLSFKPQPQRHEVSGQVSPPAALPALPAALPPVVDLEREERQGDQGGQGAGNSAPETLETLESFEAFETSLGSLVAMGFQVDRAKRALQSSRSVTGAIEELLKRLRTQLESVELVELD